MIITLSFDDEKDGELEKFKLIMKAQKYCCILEDVQRMIRNTLKHGDITEAERHGYECIQELIIDGLAEED